MKLKLEDYTKNYVDYEITKSKYYYFHRMFKEQYDVYNKDAFFKLMSHGTSGIRISFYTTGSRVTCKFAHRNILKGIKSVFNEMGFSEIKEFSAENKKNISNKTSPQEKFFDGFDVLVDNELVLRRQGFFKKKFKVRLHNPLKEKKRVDIYLPLYIETGIKYIKTNCKIGKVEDGKKVLALGDSITQGCYAGGPSSSYINLIGKEHNLDIINQAVAGYYFNEETIPPKNNTLNPDMILVAYGTNDWILSPSKEELETNIKMYFNKLVSIYPDVPIKVITPIWRADASQVTKVGKFKDVHKMIKGATKKYSNVQVIDGFNMIPHWVNYYFDGFLHPNDDGFVEFATNLSSYLFKATSK